MTTVRDIIVDALEDLVVQADEAEIEPSEAKTAIRVLNQLMAMYDSDGISLGFTTVNSLDDTITIPEGAVLPVVSNLAMRLAPKYLTGEVPSHLIVAARKGYKILCKIANNRITTAYPGTLPIGSGNEYPAYDFDKFYPEQSGTILSEQNGSISLEDGTEESVDG